MAKKTVKNYSSIYNIKDLVRNSIMPRYFEMDDTSDMNMGFLGFTTDVVTTTTEDCFNTVTTMIKEMFPNTARLSDSIYSYAALFQISELMATPASLNVLLMINERDIIKFSQTKDSKKIFYLDSNTIIDINGVQFMPDYDIKIQSSTHNGKMIYTCMYDYTYTNSLNTNTSTPFITHIRYSGEEGEFLGLQLKVHQVNKNVYEDVIVNNTILNNPKFNIEYSDMLANFEIFYKAPTDTEFVQLTKRIKNSVPIEEPFCYYKFKDTNELEISFNTKAGYFQPEFNAEVKINYYTTQASAGNFERFTGTDEMVTVIPNSEKYDYNNTLTMICLPQGPSQGGNDTLTLDKLKNIVNEKFSTINTITTENDLILYFNNTVYRTGTDVLFLKKRDDVFERLFTSFLLFKDRNGESFYTNTLHTIINPKDIIDTGEYYLIKPGSIFKYDGTSLDTCKKNTESIDDYKASYDEIVNSFDGKSRDPNDFIYTNPYLVTIHKSNIDNVAFFLNSLNTSTVVNYSYINDTSSNQFICTNLNIMRNAMYGTEKNTYVLTVEIMAAGELSEKAFDETGVYQDIIKMKAIFTDKKGEKDIAYLNLEYDGYTESTKVFKFKGKFTTEDEITMDGQVSIDNVIDINPSDTGEIVVPYMDEQLKICVFFKKGDGDIINHPYQFIPDVKDMVMTNIYATIDNPITLLYPFDIVRSQMEYIPVEDSPKGFSLYLKFMPLLFVDDVLNKMKYDDLLIRLVDQYNFLNSILSVLENNYSIDLKFFNTYGRARIFKDDYYRLLNRVNCKIKLQLKLLPGTDENTILTNVKAYISDFFQSLNISKDNSIKVSNLIQELENEFEEIDYLKFVCINEYDADIQVLRNTIVDPASMPKREIMNYVPEFISIRDKDIILEIISE